MRPKDYTRLGLDMHRLGRIINPMDDVYRGEMLKDDTARPRARPRAA